MRIYKTIQTCLILVLLLLLSSCALASRAKPSADLPSQSSAGLPDNAVFSREQAIQRVQEVTVGSVAVEVFSYPELDKESDGTVYYFIQTIYPNKMSASYFVDSISGTVFVAFGGELDTSNPLPSPGQYAAMQGNNDLSSADTQDIPEIILPETPEFSKLLSAIGYSKKEVERQFGKEHNSIAVSYNGNMEAYLYIDQSVTFAFDSTGNVAYIYCSDGFDVGGAKPGMNFEQIQDALGETQVVQTWVGTPEDTAYQIAYRADGRTLIFFSRQPSGDYSILSIH